LCEEGSLARSVAMGFKGSLLVEAENGSSSSCEK